MDTPKDVILVVDDEKNIRDVLSLYLTKAGYEVLMGEDGKQGLAIAAEKRPSLILADYMMPVMDGMEFCRRLKSNEELKDIFFIMLTGKASVEDKIEGLDTGADEYLTKPFNNKEIVARIRAFMRISKLQREIKEANIQLKKLDRVKNDLTHMIVHDMKTPIGGIMLTMDLLLDPSFTGNMNAEQTNFLSNCKNNANELHNMVLNLLDINRMEEGKLELNYETFPPSEIINNLLEELTQMFKNREMEVATTGALDINIKADKMLIKRVIMNLLTNAIKHTPKNGKVVISVEPDETHTFIKVKDSGEGIAKEHLEEIFEKFTQLNKNTQQFNTGLGLTFCKLAVESHGGTIYVESEVGKGSSFIVKLPKKTINENIKEEKL